MNRLIELVILGAIIYFGFIIGKEALEWIFSL